MQFPFVLTINFKYASFFCPFQIHTSAVLVVFCTYYLDGDVVSCVMSTENWAVTIDPATNI